MAISFIGANISSAANGNNVTQNGSLATPSAAADGDLIVIVSSCLGRAGNEGRIGNALSYNSIVDVTSTQRVRVAWKNYLAAEDAVTIEGSGNAADATTTSLFVFRGHNSTTPIDVTTTTATGSSTNPDPAAIVPANNDCMILAVAGSSANDGAPGTVASYTVVGGGTRTDTNPASTAGAYRLLSGGGGASEDPAAFNAWTTGAWVAATIAIRDAAAGAVAGRLIGGKLISRGLLLGRLTG